MEPSYSLNLFIKKGGGIILQKHIRAVQKLKA